jgi:hypothetical protein
MATYFAAIILFAGALWLFNYRRQQRLDADPAQRELARLLIETAQAGANAPTDAVSAHLARIAKGGADRRVRLTHAVMLVRSEAAPAMYEKVLNLSRAL